MSAFRRDVSRAKTVLSSDMMAIDGSKFKASNSRGLNDTAGKLDKRRKPIEERVHRYLDLIETVDRNYYG